MRTKWVVYSDFTAIISHHVWFPIMCQLVVEINSGSAVVVRHPLSRGFLLWKIEERERVRPWRQMLRSRFCILPRNIFFNSSRVCFTNVAYCYETVVIYQRKSPPTQHCCVKDVSETFCLIYYFYKINLFLLFYITSQLCSFCQKSGASIMLTLFKLTSVRYLLLALNCWTLRPLKHIHTYIRISRRLQTTPEIIGRWVDW